MSTFSNSTRRGMDMAENWGNMEAEVRQSAKLREIAALARKAGDKPVSHSSDRK